MNNPDKEIRADAKLKNLAAEQLDTLWRLRNPEPGGEKLTLEAILVALPGLVGFSSSLASLSEFYKWLRLKRRIESAAQRANQARLELARDPSVTPADLDRLGQMVFTAETVEDGNVKAFVELSKLRMQARSLELNERKIAILEQKAAQADAAKDVLGQQISAEEQTRRLREILK
jgi:hypothetical protein